MNIEVYGTDTCPACIQAKTFLESKSIPFTYYTVGKDITVEEFVKKTESQAVPVIFIDGDKFIGFNPSLFE